MALSLNQIRKPAIKLKRPQLKDGASKTPSNPWSDVDNQKTSELVEDLPPIKSAQNDESLAPTATPSLDGLNTIAPRSLASEAVVTHDSPLESISPLQFLETKCGPNEAQKGDKRETEGVQKGVEPGSNPVQKGYREEQSPTQKGFKRETEGVQKGVEPGSNPVQKGVLKGGQKGVQKQVSSSQQTVFTPLRSTVQVLQGDQRHVLEFIYRYCTELGERTSPPIISTKIAQTLNISKDSVKTSIRRLVQKGLIERAEQSPGRGGWARFTISTAAFEDLRKIDTSAPLKGDKSGSERETQRGTERGSTAPSSSNSSYIKGLTTTEATTGINSQFAVEWDKIDFSVLNAIGFTKTHLQQIASQGCLSPELVQGSINHFGFDLKENAKQEKLKGPPLNFFMGILRKGSPYAAPANYRSEADMALEAYVRAEKEYRARKEAIRTNLRAMELQSWLDGLDEPTRTRFGGSSSAIGGEKRQRVELEKHFDTNVWPKRLEDLEREFSAERT